jgi:NAD+ synthase
MKNKIISWIRKQVKDAKASGIVIGLSGGIDSAVAAALCVKALGPSKVLGLLMPCHSHCVDAQDALLVARIFKIKTKKIDLSRPFDALIKVLPAGEGLVRNNIKPRLRMIALYYFANKFNYLVCGTGNKSELLAGYFTKYGDGGVDILPIADLYKKDVRLLAVELGVPVGVILKPPTAGLWPGQTDEGEMGITYNELDDILSRIEKKQKQVLSSVKVNKVKAMIRRSGHKRCGAQICKI